MRDADSTIRQAALGVLSFSMLCAYVLAQTLYQVLLCRTRPALAYTPLLCLRTRPYGYLSTIQLIDQLQTLPLRLA